MAHVLTHLLAVRPADLKHLQNAEISLLLAMTLVALNKVRLK